MDDAVLVGYCQPLRYLAPGWRCCCSRAADGRRLLPRASTLSKAAALKALQLDQNLSEAHSALGVCMPMLGVDPRMDEIRSDPRYQELLRRLDLAKYFPQ